MKMIKGFLSTCLILTCFLGYAGKDKVETATPVTVISSEDIIKKGVWNFSLNQQLGVFTGGVKHDGEKTGKQFNIRGGVEANRFLVNGFGVGAGVNFGTEKTTYTEVTPEEIDRVSNVGGRLNLLYGRNVGGVVNVITKASIGYGSQTTLYGSPDDESKSKQNYLGLNLTANVPLEVGRNVYFTPYVGYGYKHTTGENFKENRSSFIAGFNMDFFMGCGDKMCDFGGNPSSLEDRYQPGSIMLGSRMKGYFRTGGQTQTYNDNEDQKYKDAVGKSHLTGYGLYYPVRNLGVGAGIDFGCDRSSSKDNDYKTRSTDFRFSPIVRYNLPFNNHLKDIYVEGSFGAGFSNQRTESMDVEVKNKATVTGWEVSAGYNYFIGERFSMSPMVGFSGETYNYKDSGGKYNYSGLIAGVGWNFYIP